MVKSFRKQMLSVTLAGVLVLGSIIYAGADEYDDAIADVESEAAYTQQQIDDHYAMLDELEGQKASLLEQISDTDQQLVLTLASISTLSDQINIKTQDLNRTMKELESAEADEKTQYEAMKKRIQYIYEEGGEEGWVTSLLEDSDISDYLNRAEYTKQMHEYDRDCLAEYASTVDRISALKAREEQEKSDLELMLANQEEQQAYFEEQLVIMQSESENYDEQIAYASDMAAAYVDLLNQQNGVIQELLYEQELKRQAEAEAAAEAERQRIAAEEAARQAAEEEAARQAAEEAARQAAEAAAAQQPAEDTSASGQNNSAASDPTYSAGTGNAIVDRAYAWLGRAEYVWGGCSPGAFDCSGFVSYCVTGAYARIGTTYTFLGYPQVSNPQPGDICTSDTHCGIYIGGGQMIHCADYGIGVIIGPVPGNMIYVRY